jgi:hypothetical protein
MANYTNHKKTVNPALLNDQYIKQWQTGLSQTTKSNYLITFEKWVNFLGMTPTEQIEKRIADLTSTDLSQRNFFENKFRDYKAFLESSGDLTSITVKTQLISVASFFGRTVGKLNLKRGDWNSSLQTRIKNRLSIDLKDVKAMYAHASLRDRCLLLILAQSGFSEVDVSEFRIEDLNGIYEAPINAHFYIEKQREKTGEIQATCLSFEALHDLRDYLSELGNPKEGYLFTSQTKISNEGIAPKRIHEAMGNLALKAMAKEKASEFKTKILRSFYNSALLRADLKSEIKDIMMGHQRLGARGHYGFDSQTIIEAYTKAFEHLSINGIQSQEDLANIKNTMQKQSDFFTQIITELKTKNNQLETEQNEIKAMLNKILSAQTETAKQATILKTNIKKL